MSDKYTRGKVRDFQLTLDDAGRLAECLNSFDDSDSWPDGFTHGTPFTAERVFDDKKKKKDIRDLVAYTDDKIVGECNVCHATLDKEAAYVGLLGVNPKYQGKGFGKALLIEAAQTAADAGKRRIDLHTWAGNLKALPLYKRTGYNWVPGTRVLMESHIPAILMTDMFRPFFKRYGWYDSYKREIEQEPDDVVEDGIGIFTYKFEGENGDSLDIKVDREAKGICAFRLTLDGNTVSASVQPKNHTAYIGYDQYPVELTIQNNLEQVLEFSVDVKPEKDIVFQIEGETTGKIDSGESFTTTGLYSLSNSARPINRETNADEKVATFAEWVLTIGKDSISLYSGLIPIEAVTVTPGPVYPSISKVGSSTIGLGARNNTGKKLQGEISLAPPKGVRIIPERFNFELEPSEVIEEQVTISSENFNGNLISIDYTLDLDYKGKPVRVSSKKFNIPAIGVKGAVVYKSMDERIVLETESIRAVMNDRPATGFRSLTYKPLNRSLGGWRILGIEIGYPFPSGGDEWSRLTPKIELKSSNEYAEVKLMGDFQERPGLHQTLTYRLHSGINILETISELENAGESKIDNLGLRTVGWFGGVFDQGFVPLRGEIYNLDSIDWGGWRQLPKSAKDYHESWIAMHRHQERLLLGYLWESEHAEELKVMRGWDVTRAEYRLPDLEPGENLTKTAHRMYLGDGDWRKVRALYRKLNGKDEPDTEIIDLRSDIEVEISPKKNKYRRKTPSPILVDRSKESEYELRLRLIHETPLDADIRLTLPDGITTNGNREVEMRVDEVGLDKPFSHPLRIKASEDGSWFRGNGEIEIRFKSRIYRKSLSAVVFDSTLEVERHVTKAENATLHSLSTGGYYIGTCPEQGGSLVKYGKEGKSSVLYDTFPEVGPFVWMNKVYSGLNPMLIGLDVWDWESALQEETWDVSNDQIGPWVGFKAATTLTHSPGLNGLKATAQYLILPGTPLLYIQISLTNTSKQWNKPLLGFRGIPMPGGNPCSRVHTVKERKRLVYEPTTIGVDLFAGRSSWGAYESPNDSTVLGIISAYKWDETVYIDTLSEKAQIFGLRERRALKVDESTSLAGYLVISDSVDTVEILSDLPEVIE
ncbi:MAG: GNAT family N-acetyltransferase [Candidatus Thorarchaeota archaeon]